MKHQREDTAKQKRMAELRKHTIQNALLDIDQLTAQGDVLWPEGIGRAPGADYPQSFVAYIRQGGGQVRDCPAGERAWCERLVKAWNQFPRTGGRLVALMSYGGSNLNDMLWEQMSLTLSGFMGAYTDQWQRTLPGAGRLAGSDDPFALLSLAPRWRELRGQLDALQTRLLLRQAELREEMAGRGARTRKGGRPSILAPNYKDKKKQNIYRVIWAMKQEGKRPAAILDEVKGKKDLVDRIKEAGMKPDRKLIRAALRVMPKQTNHKSQSKKDS